MKNLFVLYDSRAKNGDTDSASVYVTASSKEEALKEGQDSAWQDGIWFEYSCTDGVLTNGKIRRDLPPNQSVEFDRAYCAAFDKCNLKKHVGCEDCAWRKKPPGNSP